MAADDPAVSCALLGWPPDGPQLVLDHERFAYAGKFVMTNTGKAVAWDRDGEGPTPRTNRTTIDGQAAPKPVVAAASFNADRTDEGRLWIRYLTVARDRRGEGIGPELAGFVRDRARSEGYERIAIAVNNPFAYEALYRAGFAFTGDTTGIAELVLECPLDGRPPDRSPAVYREGLDRFADRDLSTTESTFLDRRLRAVESDGFSLD